MAAAAVLKPLGQELLDWLPVVTDLTLIIERDPEEAEAGEVLVDGSVGGHPYRFRLDTGAAMSRVAFDDYTMGFVATAQGPSSGVFKPSSDHLITVPSVQIGPISRQNVTLARAAPEAADVSNLIGMDLLKDFSLHFDFANKRLAVDPTDDVGEGHTFHAMKLDKRLHLYLDVECGQTTASAVWDSGASLTVADTTFVSQHATFFRKAGQSVGKDSTGQEMAASLFVVSGVVIGNTAFPPHRVAAVDLSGVNATIDMPMDFILGYSTLRHAEWLLDFPHRRWALLPTPAVE